MIAVAWVTALVLMLALVAIVVGVLLVVALVAFALGMGAFAERARREGDDERASHERLMREIRRHD